MSLLPFFADPWATTGMLDPFSFAFDVPAAPTTRKTLPSRQGTLVQPMDIEETDNSYEIYTDVPGMCPEDVSIDFSDTNQVLTIKAEHVDRQVKEGGGFQRTERTRRSFSRSFTVPSDAMPDQITASIDNGVLNVHVPKRPEQERVKEARRKIPINLSAGRAQIGASGAETGRTGAQPTVGRADVGRADVGRADVGKTEMEGTRMGGTRMA